MTALHRAIDDYLALRRRLGSALHEATRVLHLFARFAEHEGATRVTTDLARRWATHCPNLSPVSVNTRFQIVRRFAEWRHVTDPLTEIPPIDLLPATYHRKPPSLYQDADIDRLLDTARRLPSPLGLRGRTYATLFGLLVVTGLRISEALALDDADVRRHDAQLMIRRSKCEKSRLVPLHASTLAALAAYAKARDRLIPRRTTPAFFVSEQGVRLTVFTADYTFARISGQIGLRAPVHGHRRGHGPRLHDLRHRFAIQTLITWYRAGLEVDPRLPLLATYLGHVHVSDTYWYLEAVPELLALATERCQATRKEVAR
jgi:site-specific recombinase XerD